MVSEQPSPKPVEVSPESRRGVKIRRRSLVIAFLAALGCVGLAYLIGWGSQRHQLNTVREGLETEAAQQDARITELEARVSLLEARRLLALSLNAMDERNFGIAASHLQSAGRVLSKSEAGTKPSEIAQEIAAFRLVATENLAQQRQPILNWSKALDEVIAPPK